MKRSHTQDYQMLTRVVDFATNNVGLFPETSAAAEVVAALQAATLRLSAQATARVSSDGAMRTSRNARIAARAELRSRLYLYEQAGTALNIDKFRAPRKRTDAALIDSGHAFAMDIEPLKVEFTRHGLQPEALTSAVQALERAILDYTAAEAMRSAAIREFDKSMEGAWVYLSRLEVLVATCLPGNPTAMAAWTVARNISRGGVRRRAVESPEPAPTAAAA